MIEAAEEVDRLRLRHPERPRVELVEPAQPTGPEERLQIHGDEASENCTEGREPRDGWPAAPWRQAPTEPVPGKGSEHCDRETGHEDLREPQVDADHEFPDPNDPIHRDADDVGHARKADELAPRAPAPQGEQDGDADSK